MNLEEHIVTSLSEIVQLEGKRAVARGRYRAIQKPIKGIPKPNVPAECAVLDLMDGTTLFLEALDSARSLRPSGELNRFDGRMVRVKGVLHSQMPSRGQSLVAPCISDIDEITGEQ